MVEEMKDESVYLEIEEEESENNENKENTDNNNMINTSSTKEKDIEQDDIVDLDLDIDCDSLPLDEKEGQENQEDQEEDPSKKMTRIGNKLYDEHTLNRITIVRLTQLGIPPSVIKNMLKVSGALLYKWVNFNKREVKKMGRPTKFEQEELDFIYKTSEGKLTVENKVSSSNIAAKFFKKFNKKISYSYVCKLLLQKFGRPYRGLNSVLLTDDHISQRLCFSNEIINNGIKSEEIMFTDECNVVLFPRINPKINVIRLNDEDKKNIHTFEVNQKRTYFRPKYETSIMVAGGITKYGLSNLIFCSGTMNNFSYKQFLLFMKQDMDEIKKKYNLKNDLLFQQDNASCHKSRESLDAIDVIFGKNKIWWPANSPDLSPIETVWAIVKQELSKKKNANLEDLRNNLIDIWTRFPNELCEKIVGEFDDKIKICQQEEGKILNKMILNKYSNSKKKNRNINDEKPYDWETIKRDKNFRLVYHDRIIEVIKKKMVKAIRRKQKEKIKSYKKSHPKSVTKLKSKLKTKMKISYEEYNKKLEKKLKRINKIYEKLINYVKKSSPTDFILNFINKGLINDRRYFINTRISKKINASESGLDKLLYAMEKDDYANKKIKNILGSLDINIKSKSDKNKLLPNKINIDKFNLETEKKENENDKNDKNNKNTEQENNNGNNETIEKQEYMIKDICDQLKELNRKIKKKRNRHKDNVRAIEIENKSKEQKGDENEENGDKAGDGDNLRKLDKNTSDQSDESISNSDDSSDSSDSSSSSSSSDSSDISSSDSD